VGGYILLHVVCNCVICVVVYGAYMARINVLPQKAGNGFQEDGGHVPTNFWKWWYLMTSSYSANPDKNF